MDFKLKSQSLFLAGIVSVLLVSCGGDKKSEAPANETAKQVTANAGFESARCKPRVPTISPSNEALTNLDRYIGRADGYYVLVQTEATMGSVAPNGQSISKILQYGIEYPAVSSNAQSDGRITRKILCSDDLRSTIIMNAQAPSRVDAMTGKVLRIFSFENNEAKTQGATKEEYIDALVNAQTKGYSAYAYAIDRTSFEYRIQTDQETNGNVQSLQLRFVYKFMNARSGVVGPENSTSISVGNSTEQHGGGMVMPPRPNLSSQF